MLRYIAILCLFLSGYFGCTVQSFGQDLCIYEYISVDTLTFFKELQGVGSTDAVILSLYSVSVCIFSIFLIFIRHKVFYAIFSIALTLLTLFLLTLFDTYSFDKILIDSIFRCSNYSLLLLMLFLFFYWFLSLIFLLNLNNRVDKKAR